MPDSPTIERSPVPKITSQTSGRTREAKKRPRWRRKRRNSRSTIPTKQRSDLAVMPPPPVRRGGRSNQTAQRPRCQRRSSRMRPSWSTIVRSPGSTSSSRCVAHRAVAPSSTTARAHAAGWRCGSAHRGPPSPRRAATGAADATGRARSRLAGAGRRTGCARDRACANEAETLELLLDPHPGAVPRQAVQRGVVAPATAPP